MVLQSFLSFLDICVLFEALIYSDKLCSGERNVSLCRTLFCLLHFLTVSFAFYAFFSKIIFLKSQLKVENSFLKLCKKYTFKVKLAIYWLIKIKIKKYLRFFVGGRFSVFNLFLTPSKPEVDKKMRIPRCPLR